MKNLTPEGVVMLLRSLRRYDCSIEEASDWFGGDAYIQHTESPTGLYILYEDIYELITQLRRLNNVAPDIH